MSLPSESESLFVLSAFALSARFRALTAIKLRRGLLSFRLRSLSSRPKGEIFSSRFRPHSGQECIQGFKLLKPPCMQPFLCIPARTAGRNEKNFCRGDKAEGRIPLCIYGLSAQRGNRKPDLPSLSRSPVLLSRSSVLLSRIPAYLSRIFDRSSRNVIARSRIFHTLSRSL